MSLYLVVFNAINYKTDQTSSSHSVSVDQGFLHVTAPPIWRHRAAYCASKSLVSFAKWQNVQYVGSRLFSQLQTFTDICM